ncbi:hypothetical protein [Sphingobium sp. Ant17]|uniref:hypothetical protein n=1 Tax=Sphingobium sp. Ant17 TaxID=1461752 RepID=UPI0004AC71A6|nr:hypothetical protein [Sphingobium sp. Ant17]
MRLDDTGLLTALHEGMFQQPLWQDFLERLRQRTGAVYTTLVFRPVDEDAIVELYAGRPRLRLSIICSWKNMRTIPGPTVICAKGGSMRWRN